jgi:F-type H+-transporting ATPase subunit b
MLKRLLFCPWAVAIGAAMSRSALASGGEADINPVGPQAWKLDLNLWTAVVFLCLLAILWKFAWGPLAAAIDRRERNIADQIAEAEAANQKAKDILAGYEQKLAAAAGEVRGIVDQGRRDAEKLGRELLDKAKTEAATEHARALKQIEAAADAAVKSLADQSAAMAVELAGKIVRAKLNPADHAKLIEQAVSGFVGGKGDTANAIRN